MTSHFTASNGYQVHPAHTGDGITLEIRTPEGHAYATVYPVLAETLREYFEAERDQELVRWRSKNHPDYVVYPVEGKTRDVRVTNEATGVSRSYRDHPDYLEANTQTRTLVAREYFAANPEPRPWEDAAEDDIWLLDGADHRGTLKPYQAVIDTDGETIKEPRFFPAYRTEWTTGAFPREFTAGRRIWPTEESDDE